jgi:gliding motility-associated-like protein
LRGFFRFIFGLVCYVHIKYFCHILKKRILYILLGLMLFAKVGMGQTISVVSSKSTVCDGEQFNLTITSSQIIWFYVEVSTNSGVSWNKVSFNLLTTGSGSSWTYLYPGISIIANSRIRIQYSTISSTDLTNNPIPSDNGLLVNWNPLPNATVAASSTICNGVSVSLGATPVSGSTYSWTSSAGSYTSTSPNPSVSPSSTQTYTLTETITATGCFNSNNIAITVNQRPTATLTLSPNPIGNNPICLGEDVSLRLDVVSSGTWSITLSDSSKASGNLSSTDIRPIRPNSDITYSIATLSDANCYSNLSDLLGTVAIVINPLPIVSISNAETSGNTNNDGIICTGASITLSGAGATSYIWDNGITNNTSFVPLSTITYTVTGTDVNGCVNTATKSVTVNQLPTVTATSTPSSGAVCIGDNATLNGSGAASYIWSGGVTNGTAFAPTTTTTYTVTGTDANGCVNTATTLVTVNQLPAAPVANSASLNYNGLLQTTPDLNPPSGQSILWFTALNGGVSSTKPQGINVATYNSYASTKIDATGCISSSRTLIFLTITSASLSITGITGANKIYDGTTNATINGTASYVGLVSADAGLAIAGTPTFNFDNKNKGTAKPITVSGYTAPSANYILTQPTGLIGDITPKTAIINIVANDKPFDGTTAATVVPSSPSFISSDIVTINYTSATFDTKDVGTNKTVTVTGINLQGLDAPNYVLASNTATASADIIGNPIPFAVPNAFTPNGDGKNDKFKIIFNNTTGVTLRMQIYNRNGILMFSTNDISEEWDGRYKDVMQDMGIYFVKYRIEIAGGATYEDTPRIYLLK